MSTRRRIYLLRHAEVAYFDEDGQPWLSWGSFWGGIKMRRLDRDNVAELLDGADVVLDGSDNFATRLVISDHLTRARIPLVSASIGQFEGQLAVYRGWEADKPCYRCFVGDAFDADDCDTCSALGVLGAMAGTMGSWAAMEAIRQIVGFGGDRAGHVHVFDGLAPAMRTIRIVKDPGCKTCGAGPLETPRA